MQITSAGIKCVLRTHRHGSRLCGAPVGHGVHRGGERGQSRRARALPRARRELRRGARPQRPHSGLQGRRRLLGHQVWLEAL